VAFNNLGLQEPSTITARVATVTIQRGSTLEHQEILVLGDPTSSNAVAAVTNAAPSTSVYGLAVRQVDAVQSAQSGTWTVRANLSSTAADNPVTVLGSVAVAPVIGTLQSYAASTTGQSTSTTIVSSNATTRPYVYALSVISTVAGPVQWGIYSGSTLLWVGVLAALSSAVSGANLAVSPPGYLVAGSTGQPLTFNCASSNAGLTVSLAYWVA
jgi:hypothetical protein